MAKQQFVKQKDRSTAEFILDTVAPLFNRKGYVGTSLSDITEATQLTKGAIYCNFKNKEDLALQAFYKNVEHVIAPMTEAIRAEKNAIDKLLSITRFYRTYYQTAGKRGGCPVLNVGVDAKHVNPPLYQAAREIANNLMGNLERIITKGIQYGQIHPETDARKVAQSLYAFIEGGIYVAFLNDDEHHLLQVLDLADGMIRGLANN